MTLGSSLFLIAVGAILHYAVTADTDGFNVNTAGTILMVVGGIGLIVGLAMMAMASRRGGVVRDRDVVRERDVL